MRLSVLNPALVQISLPARSTIIVLVTVPATSPAADAIVKRLRWVMLGAMLFDFANTLFGQPSSYWHHPETFNESNHLVRLFLARGWTGYLLFDLFYFSGAFLLVSILPGMIALVCIFSLILAHFMGSSNWFFFRWRMGMETPVIYGILLSAIVVLLAFSRGPRPSTAPNTASEAEATSPSVLD